MIAADTRWWLISTVGRESMSSGSRAPRRVVLRKGCKARVGNALIAQSCIDHDIALITRDRDFRHFVAHCGLKLA
jgi:hypothetical protein